MEDNQIVDLVIEKLNNEDMWFTQKTDPTWDEPSSYYKLDEYGNPTETAIKQIAKEVNSFIGDGAVDLEDAIQVWVDNATMEYKVAYKGSLVTKFKNKPVVDQIEAYESQVLTENKQLVFNELLEINASNFVELRDEIERLYNEKVINKNQFNKFITIIKKQETKCEKDLDKNSNEDNELYIESEYVVDTLKNLIQTVELNESKKEMSIQEIVDWIEKTGHIKMYNEYASREENAGKPIPVLLYGFYDWVNGPDAPMVGDLDFLEDEETDKLDESMYDLNKNAEIKLGVCPYCGSKNLDIEKEPEVVEYNDYVSYCWHCKDCGKDGQEIFSMEFIGHDLYRDDENLRDTDFVGKTENKNVNFNSCTKDKKLEDYKRRLKEENNKSANLISDMFKSPDFDADSKAGQIVMRTSELFNALSGKGYDVQVAFDNGESTSAILLGQQGGQVLITITDTNQPLRAFTSGNFEINDDNMKVLDDIQNEIKTL